MIHLVYKSIRKLNTIVSTFINNVYCYYLLKGNKVSYSTFRSSGIPFVMVASGGKCSLGENFAMNNNIKGNPIGCYQKCTLVVSNKQAELSIGDNVGISQTAIVCHDKITIGDNVKIGGGVCIYDTDFHSLNPEIRKTTEDTKNKVTSPVNIGDNVFIGAHSLILKGVTIGENSIVGAGSVVAKSIPSNEIWAGNPAKFIKML